MKPKPDPLDEIEQRIARMAADANTPHDLRVEDVLLGIVRHLKVKDDESNERKNRSRTPRQAH